MDQLRATLDSRDYVWDPKARAWFGARDYVQAPLRVAQELNRIASPPPAEEPEPRSAPRKSATPGTRARRAGTHVVRPREPSPEVVRAALDAVPDGPERSYFTSTIHEIGEVARSNPDDLRMLMALMLELRHRNTKKARLLREDVVGRLIAGIESYFPWPDTFADGGDGSLDSGYFEYATGLLGFMGYHVGTAQGLPTEERRELLNDVFRKQLPRVNSPEYMAKWGTPDSARRLQQMAESIACSVRNAKRRRDAAMAIAVQEWEADLAYLKAVFYRGRFDFGWPSTESAT